MTASHSSTSMTTMSVPSSYWEMTGEKKSPETQLPEVAAVKKCIRDRRSCRDGWIFSHPQQHSIIRIPCESDYRKHESGYMRRKRFIFSASSLHLTSRDSES